MEELVRGVQCGNRQSWLATECWGELSEVRWGEVRRGEAARARWRDNSSGRLQLCTLSHAQLIAWEYVQTEQLWFDLCRNVYWKRFLWIENFKSSHLKKDLKTFPGWNSLKLWDLDCQSTSCEKRGNTKTRNFFTFLPEKFTQCPNDP